MNGCLSLCVGPVTDWRPIQDPLSCLMAPGRGSSPSSNPDLDKRKKTVGWNKWIWNGWFDKWMDSLGIQRNEVNRADDIGSLSWHFDSFYTCNLSLVVFHYCCQIDTTEHKTIYQRMRLLSSILPGSKTAHWSFCHNQRTHLLLQLKKSI